MNKNNKGFTILELMIATTAFSIMLLGMTSLIVQMGRMYYKGLNMSRSQNITRGIVDDVSRKLQFGKGDIAKGTTTIGSVTYNTYCVGSSGESIYIYNTYDGPADPDGTALYLINNNFNCTVSSLATAKNLLGNNNDIYLMKFLICPTDSGCANTPGPNQAAVELNLVYSSGGNDLIDSTNDTCRSTKGSEWCGVSSLSTLIYRRIPDGI